jgi:hypothetical protein
MPRSSHSLVNLTVPRMMVGALPISFRVPNADTIVRFDPDFPELETTYTRCQ